MTACVNLTTVVINPPFRLASGDVYSTLTLGDNVNHSLQFKTSDLPALVELVNRASRVWTGAKIDEAILNEGLKTS